ncbi:MAG: cytochrome c oxidase accessory protein CcoG [Magnetococcales bacterium]|nr:cytochrome c oxidase accessory protein CcoG [Magnetococcales bacterium]MBF0151229.1 cytochrome c oxidase accessory protein CcoG [Magnetococcales bacterium]MBF0175006.1 cytochrome c oxidase accessory protein CcoG [Magnetococcales bacterium]MBF0348819.1 cytochrome c oxidase accessory protein CcoG [Magnetococcales bacterium]MBF0632822.1 cytochrome c oxidase accessory protein CcoG [Magnetococcales bacterium]
MSEGSGSLYSDWKKLYPRYQSGFFRNLRWSLILLWLGIYYILPFIRWERPGNLPNQAVLFDLPERKFYIFDLVVWPQEIFLLALLLIAAALGLFFITALAGRVFCGYMCFQTVWTDLFLQVERWFEGNRKRRIKLDQSPWNLDKVLRKLGKHVTWLLIGLATAGVFVFYFADAPTLLWGFLTGDAPFAAWMTLLFLTLTTYLMAGFAREQVCIYMCPYARFQGAMFDDDTIIVAYHPELGEPRQVNRRKRLTAREPVGLCIDCRECVTVCPTGIDIRNGQQYECITCGSCIDACNSVKDKLHLDNELIRYTSLREMRGEKTHWFRFRILAYGTLLLVFLGGIVGYFFQRSMVELNVVHHRQPTFISLSDGGVQNNFTIRVLNMSGSRQTYRLEVSELPGASLKVAAVDAVDQAGHPLLTLEPGEVAPYTVYLKQEARHVQPGSQEMTFRLAALDPKGGESLYHSVFMRR